MSNKKSTELPRYNRSIKMGDIDQNFKYAMKKVSGFERLRLCFQCGSCTADCPISRFSEIYHPRKLMRMTQLGMKDKVLVSQALWLCAACYTCVDHCPQNVNIAGVLTALRNMAIDEGIIPPVFRVLMHNILKTGYAYRIPELRQKKRTEKGLPVLPKANLDDLVKLFELLTVSKVAEKEKQ
ncbi:4Fe-4S dicluster domain-containing protein [Candidatus Bathyarchaeota archaeon]|nr:4Fe-4S dicluster domain-containing protein [Candidatus Bathyarchaeota archaeon]